MHRAWLVVFSILVVSGQAQPAIADEESPLRVLLSQDEFDRAGLSKLTPDELAALEAALQSRGLLKAEPAEARPPPAKDSLFGAEMLPWFRPAESPEAVRTRIDGTFSGWNGKTVFRLENGQVWQQRTPGRYVAVRKLENPEVVLQRGAFGYRMLVVDIRQEVLVKRIQ